MMAKKFFVSRNICLDYGELVRLEPIRGWGMGPYAPPPFYLSLLMTIVGEDSILTHNFLTGG